MDNEISGYNMKGFTQSMLNCKGIKQTGTDL